MKIDVKNISYSYNNSKTFAVKDASTSITNGEFVAIVGHTGSGKSTFIQNLNGLLIPIFFLNKFIFLSFILSLITYSSTTTSPLVGISKPFKF